MNKPEFNDVFAKTSRTRHNKFDGYVVEILYGAKDAEGNPCAPQADADDGHGRWYGIDVNGDYTMFQWKHSKDEGGAVEYGTKYEDKALEVMEDQLQQKRDLCLKAEQLLADSGDEAALEEIKKQWDALDDWGTPKDKECAKRFARVTEEFGPLNEARKAASAAKEAVVQEAEKLREAPNFANARKQLRDLRDKLRDLESAGEAADREFASRINAVDRELRQKQEEYNANRETRYAEAKEKKTAIIEETKKAVASVTNFKDGAAKLDDLFQQWRAAGSAGHEEDDTLWASFNEARQQFYDKRKEFFKQRNEAFKESVAKKEALIEEAKKISDTADYGRENTDRMKQLDKEWTAAGYSGKTDNDRLWKEFNDAKEVFWNGKRGRAMKRISDSLESKKMELTKLKHNNDDLAYRIDITDAPNLKDEFQRTIDFNESRIESLQKEIDELEERLK